MIEGAVSTKIIRNTIFNALGRIWGMLVALILTPYIIHHIGIQRYGIWAIVVVFTGYFGLLDFGIGTSFVKYIAEFYTKKDFLKINQVINTGFVFYLLFAACIVTFFVFIIGPLFTLLKIPGHLYNEASFVFLLGVIIFCVSNVFSVFLAIQNGLQRMDIVNKVLVAISIPNIVGTIFFLENGYGMPGLMINNAFILGISSVVNVIIAFKILPQLRIDPFLFSGQAFGKLFHFGYKLQVSRFANLVSFQTDKLLISHFLGVGMVTFYQLGSSIVQKVRQVPLFLISALIPFVSEIEAKEGKQALARLYLRGSKYLIFISTPFLFFLLVNAYLIMAAWMGQGYEQSVLVIQLLAVGYFSATVTGVASSIAAGVARTDLDMKFGLFLAVTNLFLSIILIIKMGFIGAVLGTTIALSLSSCLFIKMFHVYLGMPIGDFVRLFYKPVISCILPAAIIGFLNYYLQFMKVSGGRIVNLSILSLNFLIFVSLYMVSIFLSRYLDSYDKELLKSKIPFLKYLLG